MNFTIKKGLDIPISGEPVQTIQPGNPVTEIGLLGFDYVGLKPSMAVKVGEQVTAGQLLFTDKKNPGVKFTAPIGGTISAINRGPRRRFESIVIRVAGNERLSFQTTELTPVAIKATLIESGQWTALRTRPYGKVPTLESSPSSLFITAMDTQPLAADPAVVINQYLDDFILGVKILQNLAPKTFLCTKAGQKIPTDDLPGIIVARFAGPHPAGLASTHIHFLDPVRPGKEVWQIDYQEVIAIGHLFGTGYLQSERVVALTGPAMKKPRLIKTLAGASITELAANEINDPGCRLLAGSVLSGHRLGEGGVHGFLGRHQHQVCALTEGDGSGFLNWLRPGGERFSTLPLFISTLLKKSGAKMAMNTAAWGGKRAIFPLGTYEKVMPLNLIATSLLKSIATGNTEKAAALGCLELVEEDLALCSFVCPGKNNFGPMLREVLTRIEEDG
ncbi:MAG: Na(+)-translocating NADH-quinone reductase subunit A [Desulfobulbaceae bacterium]|nr:Na(+)-translocating NADH-quinone reductase subunit A [Desulfobulbaceae bacterium]HIJ79917.1 Na(+)-translocating NADH-quinone reductase subunit A [Deltaproteobacteria bacterium]